MQNAQSRTDEEEISFRNEPTKPFSWQGREIYDVFLPIMGPDCLAVYCYFTDKQYPNPIVTYSVRSVAESTDLSPATVSRSLSVLEFLRLVTLRKFGGNKESECRLLDSRVAAERLGAICNPKTRRCSLPSDRKLELRSELKEFRRIHQGKSTRNRTTSTRSEDEAAYVIEVGDAPRVSLRNTGVSHMMSQPSARETQGGSHLLIKEKRNKYDPSPTPSQEGVMKNSTDFSSPEKPHLKWAQDRLNGVIDDLRDHLLDTNKPSLPNLANGFADWDKFGFADFVVEEAQSRSAVLELILSAPDPVAAQRGIEKYQRRWETSTRNWFNCEVRVTFLTPTLHSDRQ